MRRKYERESVFLQSADSVLGKREAAIIMKTNPTRNLERAGSSSKNSDVSATHPRIPSVRARAPRASIIKLLKNRTTFIGVFTPNPGRFNSRTSTSVFQSHSIASARVKIAKAQ